MKTLRRRFQDAAELGQVNQMVIERDYAQSYVLLGLAQGDALRDTLVFKGGTALKKIYVENYRFSEDLDFSSIDGPVGADLEAAIVKAVARAQEVARSIAPLAFVVERTKEQGPHPGGQESFVVRIQFPWHREPMVPVKIEVTRDEPVVLEAKHCRVRHGYDETLDATVRTYCLEEIAAEKLRATQQTLARLTARGWSRPRARDYYDLWHLVREPDHRLNWEKVSAILPEKCRLRAVTIASINVVFDKRLIDEVRAAWQPTLGPFVRDLPPIDGVLVELRERLVALVRL